MREDPDQIVVRPLADADVEAAWRCAVTSLARMAQIYEPGQAGSSLAGATDEAAFPRGRARVRHLLKHDAPGAWVAVDRAADHRVVGVGLALVRGDLWFLSLLAVETDYQARGVGRRLIDATMTYGEGVRSGWILASGDPKALRRYRVAGFELRPGYLATGQLDRTAIPADLGVRDGDWDRDGELVDALVADLRGAPYGPEHEYFRAWCGNLKIVDGQGYAIVRPTGVMSLGARSPEVAARLLWAGLAESTQAIELEWLVAEQQWALDVALAARLSLLAGPSSCPRGITAPLTPFIPSGAFG